MKKSAKILYVLTLLNIVLVTTVLSGDFNPFKAWTSGETLTALDLNTMFTDVQTAVNDNNAQILTKQKRVDGVCTAGNSIRTINADGTVVCEPDTDTDTNTTYTAGTGLTMSGTTISPDTSYLQRRVGTTCAAGSSIRIISATGAVTCQVDSNSGGDITGITTGASSGLSGGVVSGTANLSVDFAGTGAATTAAKSDHYHLAGVYYVNNTAEFEQAIVDIAGKFLTVSSFKIKLAPGNYALTTAMTVPVGVIIEGSGQRLTKITGAFSPLITMKGENTLKDVWVQAASANAVSLDRTLNYFEFNIENSWIYSSLSSGSTALNVTNSGTTFNYVNILDSRIGGSSTGGDAYGIYASSIAGGIGITLSNSDVTANAAGSGLKGFGVYLALSSSLSSRNGSIIRAWSGTSAAGGGGAYGIVMSTGGGIYAYDSQITANAYGSTSYGVHIAGTQGAGRILIKNSIIKSAIGSAKNSITSVATGSFVPLVAHNEIANAISTPAGLLKCIGNYDSNGAAVSCP